MSDVEQLEALLYAINEEWEHTNLLEVASAAVALARRIALKDNPTEREAAAVTKVVALGLL